MCRKTIIIRVDNKMEKTNPSETLAVDALKTAFNHWTANHKTPNKKCIAISHATLISPKELNVSIQNGNGYGHVILDWLKPEVMANKTTPTQAINTLMYHKGGMHR